MFVYLAGNQQHGFDSVAFFKQNKKKKKKRQKERKKTIAFYIHAITIKCGDFLMEMAFENKLLLCEERKGGRNGTHCFPILETDAAIPSK